MLKYIDYLPLMFRGRFPSFEIFKDVCSITIGLQAQQRRSFKNLQLFLMTYVCQVLLPDIITSST